MLLLNHLLFNHAKCDPEPLFLAFHDGRLSQELADKLFQILKPLLRPTAAAVTPRLAGPWLKSPSGRFGAANPRKGLGRLLDRLAVARKDAQTEAKVAEASEVMQRFCSALLPLLRASEEVARCRRRGRLASLVAEVCEQSGLQISPALSQAALQHFEGAGLLQSRGRDVSLQAAEGEADVPLKSLYTDVPFLEAVAKKRMDRRRQRQQAREAAKRRKRQRTDRSLAQLWYSVFSLVFAEFSARMRTWAPRPASPLLKLGLLLLGASALLPEAFSTPGPRRCNLAQPRKASPSEPAARTGDSSGFATPISAGAVACLLLLASALPNAAVAQDFFGGGGPDDGVDRRSLIERSPPQPPPAGDKAPDIAPEERERRRTTPSTEISNEEWYKYGKEVFVAKCAGCHPGGMNQIRISRGLNVEDLERWGLLKEPQKITEIIRYGQGTMPGFAADCPEKSGVERCGVVVPLDEATLIDVEDFMMNRANSGWRGRG
ncbi:Cytochrome c6 [Symbiodinium microadriaticum]|uniref:Cytochrome c6 n=1 Tax=Symbiodinium microadriaticum TaxID=2951 RepID=A0A1Q9D9H7_SYMMI|nr:Cytochrome c6 [Symbiodinium microadriaticum]